MAFKNQVNLHYFSDKLSKSFCAAPENTMQLYFFMCPVIIWDENSPVHFLLGSSNSKIAFFFKCVFFKCGTFTVVKLVTAVIKMPFGIPLRTSQYFHTHGTNCHIHLREGKDNILGGICDVHYLCQKPLQQSSTREWDKEEQGLCWERDYSLYHHKCDHSFR